jgi:hypothetical protein
LDLAAELKERRGRAQALEFGQQRRRDRPRPVVEREGDHAPVLPAACDVRHPAPDPLDRLRLGQAAALAGALARRRRRRLNLRLRRGGGVRGLAPIGVIARAQSDDGDADGQSRDADQQEKG